MEALILRFDAPLLSFGGVKVDQHCKTERFPGLSLLTGLLANALGWEHSQAEKLQALQSRLNLASRWDVEPEPLIDYQTVDLGQPKMREKGWTTRGIPEHREGGASARLGTHQRWVHYQANGIMTCCLALEDGPAPTLDDLEAALRRPARPLFLGRKTCLPAGPILVGRGRGENLLEILKQAPRRRCRLRKTAEDMSASWPAGLAQDHPAQVKPVYDRRDWRNQVHSGDRSVVEGFIREVEPCS